MEDKLRKLFDYQRFEKNEELEKLIMEAENRHARSLSDEEMILVSAAGEVEFDIPEFERDKQYDIHIYDDLPNGEFHPDPKKWNS